MAAERMAGGPNYCWSKFLWEMSERVTSVVERVIRTVCIREIDMAKINVMH